MAFDLYKIGTGFSLNSDSDLDISGSFKADRFLSN
jgi:hypothetical protein